VIDQSQMKLGRRPILLKKAMRLFLMEHYLDETKLPPVPAAHAWSDPVSDWPMYANDQIGDCMPLLNADLSQIGAS
jgi:hypothetical protein